MVTRSPIDRLLDQVEWRCTRCGTPLTQGCQCWHRTTSAEKQQLADACRQVFRTHLKASCPVVWQARSCRQSLANRLWSAVDGALHHLDRETPGGPERRITGAEAQAIATDVCQAVEGYWHTMYPTVYATVAPAYMVRFWRQVEAFVFDILTQSSERKW